MELPFLKLFIWLLQPFKIISIFLGQAIKVGGAKEKKH